MILINFVSIYLAGMGIFILLFLKTFRQCVEFFISFFFSSNQKYLLKDSKKYLFFMKSFPEVFFLFSVKLKALIFEIIEVKKNNFQFSFHFIYPILIKLKY